MSLARLIAEAQVLAGGEHQCATLGHLWESIGGRACPWDCGSSQAVHECSSCGDVDYGQCAGEPGFDWCKEHDFNCSHRLPESEPEGAQ